MKDELKVIALNLTNRCNLECIHCGRDTDPELMRFQKGAEFFLDILKQGRALGAERVNMSGGEVFVRRDIFEVIEGAVKLGYYVSLESNGTLLNDEKIQRLARLGESIRLSLSLDGFNSEVHDPIRGRGTFEKTMEAIRRVAQYKVQARVITVVHEGNINQIPEMVRYVVDELGLGFRLLPSIMEYGRGMYACSTHGINFEVMTELLEGFYYPFLREKMAQGVKKEKLTVELNTALIPPDILNHHMCPWGQYMIGIGPTGIAALCHVSSTNPLFRFGDLATETLADVWYKSEALLKYKRLNPDELHGVCGNCLAREICRGGCRLHAITKYDYDFLAPDPQCQVVYDLGKFPKYALEDEERDCSYGKTEVKS
ncbi:MAG: hypothetical protein A3B74_01260 [Candidatus Kerfeldbacteria bacterium RIFCSPHIGHO2_02_FULL_42_14]|uniref:Radical SAM core domain-containing protein n=1 Tax=Candidatus Kerfeldbacteria bacterium RIFCSPHIGHO2_02_FULL_42_14 TaxID=1798540 RepID=A0A1G2AP93_9BACT|nr:MAG: hypothetical protein A3B74_01260 [Candidatus Kerfeldbacteria bacterium RIFCSPHIGHO2_02_FULL_42_14]OGY81132.1 MAG: hypothetical protein A3E60_04725 [Candidatus Kerfeldbacteria bacterium RIFCSPHIGHO2_12_FULL_42_13]OGY84212.1 MAG: hypothetical protein A3I91_05450 [Candidatus Kerfeldbacteria bacterium RIFCSPLOWO2_02_FULL_42_19]OGY87487.1 MAG: hypothetical protein A3G01_02440 [Candidatus Kerfeldbacteria bacterium RIFCSPLOWO2_12_FULL_43_9]